MTSKINPSPDFNAMARTVLSSVKPSAVKKGVSFFRENFKQGGFRDNSLNTWDRKRNDGDSGRLLIKSGALADSIRVFQANKERIEIGTDLHYAKIHNEGGTMLIRVTPRSRKYFWAMHFRTGKGFWKGMALTKKTSVRVYIPKRKFIGESSMLMNLLVEQLKNEIESL